MTDKYRPTLTYDQLTDAQKAQVKLEYRAKVDPAGYIYEVNPYNNRVTDRWKIPAAQMEKA
jgi:hypothetical protein